LSFQIQTINPPIKEGLSSEHLFFLLLVPRTGFEPVAYGLAIDCSIENISFLLREFIILILITTTFTTTIICNLGLNQPKVEWIILIRPFFEFSQSLLPAVDINTLLHLPADPNHWSHPR